MRKPEYLRVSGAALGDRPTPTNLVGALLFALLAIFTGAFGDPVQAKLVAEGVGDTSGPLTTTFWSAVVTGWLLALVAWLVEASEHAIGQIAVIYAITLVVGLGGFDHCIATTVEAFCALFEGAAVARRPARLARGDDRRQHRRRGDDRRRDQLRPGARGGRRLDDSGASRADAHRSADLGERSARRSRAPSRRRRRACRSSSASSGRSSS